MNFLTANELRKMTVDELRDIQRTLDTHRDTPNERDARNLNHLIMDELHRRSGYGD